MTVLTDPQTETRYWVVRTRVRVRDYEYRCNDGWTPFIEDAEYLTEEQARRMATHYRAEAINMR